MLHIVGAYFYIWLKYIHMAKILVILQYSYVVRYLFYFSTK